MKDNGQIVEFEDKLQEKQTFWVSPLLMSPFLILRTGTITIFKNTMMSFHLCE